MTLVESLTRDVSQALPVDPGRRGFTLIAVLSLSLGIGVNTLMFSFMNAVLLQPLPYPERGAPGDGLHDPRPTIPGTSARCRRRCSSCCGITPNLSTRLASTTSDDKVNLTDDTSGFAAERLSGHRISSTALQALGVILLLGRFHTPARLPKGVPRLSRTRARMRPQVQGTRRRIANMARSRASNVSGSSSAIT